MHKFRIYQVKSETQRAFKGLEEVRPNPSDYTLVYEGALPAGKDTDDENETGDQQRLKRLFYIFNIEHPSDFKARSMTVSDIVELYVDDRSVYYFCDDFGFKRVPFDKTLAQPSKSEAMKYGIQAVPENETFLLYSNESRKDELLSLGYLRGDYGKNGEEFWTTWVDHRPDLKTMVFKDEFDSLIAHLRRCGILKDYNSMTAFFRMRKETKLSAKHREYNYGCKIITEGYSYYIRSIHIIGDYSFYVFVYQNKN